MRKNGCYEGTKMKKEIIIEKLKEKGFRITKQRLLILDIILEREYNCCKEIYYTASSIDKSIGLATVYRLLNTLEEIGAIKRQNIYKIGNSECDKQKDNCTVVLHNDKTFNLSPEQWEEVITAGLKACGYMD
ncbi:Ferric uptake regulation protein [Clostridium sp. N3C]|uniref:Fur family transcriptional regulator n=1 Tax=Clostridium sp. N3C TaxID=1776758 RepID=UPI00092E0FBA|nr:transcriptional repressor [Clostridium sp. N3C]SCN24918.1 Ferric uptake regulation protein [Clostridium sp. N3C]